MREQTSKQPIKTLSYETLAMLFYEPKFYALVGTPSKSDQDEIARGEVIFLTKKQIDGQSDQYFIYSKNGNAESNYKKEISLDWLKAKVQQISIWKTIDDKRHL